MKRKEHFRLASETNCDIDAFLCVLESSKALAVLLPGTINLCGAVKDIWGFATDVDGAISDCPKESFLHHYLKQGESSCLSRSSSFKDM